MKSNNNHSSEYKQRQRQRQREVDELEAAVKMIESCQGMVDVSNTEESFKVSEFLVPCLSGFLRACLSV